jgi:hypothetical protein
VLAAWQVFESALARLRAERRTLCARLAALQAHLESLPAAESRSLGERHHTLEPGIASMLKSGSLEEVVCELEDNMVRRL